MFCSIACLQVAGGRYARSTAAKVHSALQDHLTTMRRKAGRPSFQLATTDPYSSLYVLHCSKKRDRALAEAADEQCENRAAVVHTSFGRDPYVQGAHAMLASSDPQQAKLLSMYTGQVQMVARGDDLRGRKAKDLGTRNLACVGECCCEAAVLLSCCAAVESGARSNSLPYIYIWRVMLPVGRPSISRLSPQVA